VSVGILSIEDFKIICQSYPVFKLKIEEECLKREVEKEAYQHPSPFPELSGDHESRSIEGLSRIVPTPLAEAQGNLLTPPQEERKSITSLP
jgi:hypothetical protein